MWQTHFWQRMEEAFGRTGAATLAQDYVVSRLGHRTVNQALAEGEDARVVWKAVASEMELPARLR